MIFNDLHLKKEDKKKLKSVILGHEKLLKYLSKKNNKNSKRKKKLAQSGGFLGQVQSVSFYKDHHKIYNIDGPYFS